MAEALGPVTRVGSDECDVWQLMYPQILFTRASHIPCPVSRTFPRRAPPPGIKARSGFVHMGSCSWRTRHSSRSSRAQRARVQSQPHFATPYPTSTHTHARTVKSARTMSIFKQRQVQRVRVVRGSTGDGGGSKAAAVTQVRVGAGSSRMLVRVAYVERTNLSCETFDFLAWCPAHALHFVTAATWTRCR